MTLSVIAAQCQLPRKGELFPLTAGAAFNGRSIPARFPAYSSPLGGDVAVRRLRGFVPFSLVMEQPQAAEGHGDAVLVAGIDDLLVADGAAGLHDGGHAGAAGTLDVVAEGEECVRP